MNPPSAASSPKPSNSVVSVAVGAACGTLGGLIAEFTASIALFVAATSPAFAA